MGGWYGGGVFIRILIEMGYFVLCLYCMFCGRYVFFSGFHLVVTIWVYGIISGGGIDLVSLCYMGVKYVLKIFL